MKNAGRIKNSLNWFAICLTVFGVACSSDNSVEISDRGKARGNPDPVLSKPVLSAQLSLSQVSVALGDFVEFEKSLEVLFRAVESLDLQSFSCPRITKDRTISTETLHYYHLDWRYCRGGDYQRQGQDCAKVTVQDRTIQTLELTSLLPTTDPRSKKGLCSTDSTYEGLSLPVTKNTSVFLQRESQPDESHQYSYSRRTQLLSNKKDHTFELTVSHIGNIFVDSRNWQFRYVFEEFRTEWFDSHDRETTIDEVELNVVDATPFSTTSCHILVGNLNGVTRSTRLDAPIVDQVFSMTESEVRHSSLDQKRLWPSCKTGGDLFFIGFLDQYLRSYKTP